jgi:hypothetical protein
MYDLTAYNCVMCAETLERCAVYTWAESARRIFQKLDFVEWVAH